MDAVVTLGVGGGWGLADLSTWSDLRTFGVAIMAEIGGSSGGFIVK
jgi:hypothetical protein